MYNLVMNVQFCLQKIIFICTKVIWKVKIQSPENICKAFLFINL
jgi:hypothetical protein